MGVKDNYQLELIKYEEDYKDKLLTILGFLLNEFDGGVSYSKKEIKEIIGAWLVENKNELDTINDNLINNLTNYSQEIYKELDKSNTNIKKNNKIINKKEENTKLLNEINNNLIDSIENKLNAIELNYKLNNNLEDKITAIENLVNKVEKNVKNISTNFCKNVVFNNLSIMAIANGKTEYLWQTQRDARVRDTHAMMDNKWVSINNAPKITNYYHAGQDYNCRCYIGGFI